MDDDNRFGSGNFMAGPAAFFALLRQWREADTLDGLEVR